MAKISVKRVLLALGLILGLTGLLIVVVGSHRLEQANIRTPEHDYFALRTGTERWQFERQTCPTVQELQAERYIELSSATDPWGSPYLIECAGDVIKTHSLGPDRQLNTPDDVLVSKRH